MKNKTKIIIAASALVLGVASISSTAAHAVIGGRIRAAVAGLRNFDNLSGTRTATRATSGINNPTSNVQNISSHNLRSLPGPSTQNTGKEDVTKNIKGSPSMKILVNGIAEKHGTVGVDALGFDSTQYGVSSKNLYFHQTSDGNGGTKTLISQGKPKLGGINNENVTVKYKDINGEEKILVTSGAPKWLSSKDIKKGEKAKARLSMQRFYDKIKDDVNPDNNIGAGISLESLTDIWDD